ncbi:ribonucleotide reductase beta subunit family protein with ferritin-like domain [Actinopolyspora lacussalsi]|nr:ribonucleotide reductase beta subunit family protein with ferritin-like domain [Actinopolyspora lacussalsi]
MLCNAEHYQYALRDESTHFVLGIDRINRTKPENPFPWMSEAVDLKKEKNFFETRVTEYQSGAALEWD